MQLTPIQFKVIDRLKGSSDGVILVTILEDMVKELRDIRNLTECTPDAVKGHLLAGNILETELIDRLKKTSTSNDIINDSFD